MSGDGGRIITFYSYKGGTGRTMLLANAAWILASNGKRVLIVDWDLEAPGLHRYFAPFLVDPELRSTRGVIDMVTEFATEAMVHGRDEDPEWYLPYADILEYAISLAWRFPAGGMLDLVTAGRQGPSYAAQVNSFGWKNFYERLGGGAFLEAVMASMKREYDYVLVDSRTGVSDTAGVCTVQLPDALVVCFTLNNQSIEGASAVARSVVEARAGKPLAVFPVPTRVEEGEKRKLELARDYARSKFDDLVAETNRSRYWAAIELPYKKFYAYEEVLCAFGDRPDEPNSLLAPTERLVARLTNDEVTHLAAVDEEKRLEVLTRFERTPRMRGSLARPTQAAELVQLLDQGRALPGKPSTADEAEARSTERSSPTKGLPTPAAAGWLSGPRVAWLVILGVLPILTYLVAKPGVDPVTHASSAAGGATTVHDPPDDATGRKIVAAARASDDPVERLLLLGELRTRTKPPLLDEALAPLRRALPVAVLGREDRELKAAEFAPSGNQVMASSLDGTVRIFATDGRGAPKVLNPRSGAVTAFAMSNAGAIAIATEEGGLRVWRGLDDTAPRASAKEPFAELLFDPKGARLLALGRHGIVLVSVDNGAGSAKSFDANGAVAAGFVRDGERIVTLSFDRSSGAFDQISLWNPGKLDRPIVTRGLATGAQRPPEQPPGRALLVALSTRNDAVAISSGGGIILTCVVDEAAVGEWSTAARLEREEPTVLAISRGPNGVELAAGTARGSVWYWPSGAKAPRQLGGHLKAVLSIAFSPDGTKIVSTSEDGTARIFDPRLLDANSEPVVLQGSGGPMIAADFARDRVLTLTPDQVRIWLLEPTFPDGFPALQKFLQESTSACLSAAQRKTLLGEDAAAAQATYEKCELDHGRPARLK